MTPKASFVNPVPAIDYLTNGSPVTIVTSHTDVFDHANSQFCRNENCPCYDEGCNDLLSGDEVMIINTDAKASRTKPGGYTKKFCVKCRVSSNGGLP